MNITKRTILFLMATLIFGSLLAQNKVNSVDDYYRLPFLSPDTFVFGNDADSMVVITRRDDCPAVFDQNDDDGVIETIMAYVFNRGDTLRYETELLTGYPEKLYLSNDERHISRVIISYDRDTHTDENEYFIDKNKTKLQSVVDTDTVTYTIAEYYKDYFVAQYFTMDNDYPYQTIKYHFDENNRLTQFDTDYEVTTRICKLQYDSAGFMTDMLVIDQYGGDQENQEQYIKFKYELNHRGDWVILRGYHDGALEVRASIQRKIYYKNQK